MRTQFLLLVGVPAFLTWASPPLRAEERSDAPPVGRLVAGLGSTEFTEREEATRLLDRIGLAALPALRSAAGSPDLEVRRRAVELVTRIERREDFARKLADRGVPTSVVDLRIDRNSVFGGLRDGDRGYHWNSAECDTGRQGRILRY